MIHVVFHVLFGLCLLFCLYILKITKLFSKQPVWYKIMEPTKGYGSS